MRWSPEQLKSYQEKHNQLTAIALGHGLPAKPSKYRSQKVTVGDITYDSKKECARHQQLLLMERTGVISGLTRQKSFVLAPAVVIKGRRKPDLVYRCDFSYIKDGKEVIEDVKSEITAKDSVYRIKIHLMKYVHGIDVVEV